MGHALASWVGVEVHVGRGRGARHWRRDSETPLARLRSHPVRVHRGPAEVVAVAANLVGDDGDRIRPVGFSSEGLDLGKCRVGRQARWLLGEHRGFPLLAQCLLLGESLLLLAHLAATGAAAGTARLRAAFWH